MQNNLQYLKEIALNPLLIDLIENKFVKNYNQVQTIFNDFYSNLENVIEKYWENEQIEDFVKIY